MSLVRSVFGGIKWTTFSSFILVGCQLLKVAVLARYLEKSDFGLMALLTFIIGLISLFMDSGLTSALFHKQTISLKEYSSLFWLNLFFSFFLYIVIFLFAPLIATFYNENRLEIFLKLMGLSLIISSLGILFRTLSQKELQFKFVSLVDVFTNIISLLIAIYLAINSFGIMALIISYLFQYSMSNIIFLIRGICINKLIFYINLKTSKPFIKIGSFQVAGQLVNYFNRDLDILVIGKYFSSEILGGYSLAKQLVFRPSQLIYPIFTTVATPYLVKFQRDIKLLGDHYLKLTNIISTINIPLYTLIIILANPIIRVLYGSNFLNVTPLVQILSLYMILRSSGNAIGCLTIATGRTDLEFYWNTIMLLIMPIAILIGSQFSVVAVAWSIFLAMLVLFIPFWYFLVWKIIKVPFNKYLFNLLPSTSIYSYINALLR